MIVIVRWEKLKSHYRYVLMDMNGKVIINESMSICINGDEWGFLDFFNWRGNIK